MSVVCNAIETVPVNEGRHSRAASRKRKRERGLRIESDLVWRGSGGDQRAKRERSRTTTWSSASMPSKGRESDNHHGEQASIQRVKRILTSDAGLRFGVLDCAGRSGTLHVSFVETGRLVSFECTQSLLPQLVPNIAKGPLVPGVRPLQERTLQRQQTACVRSCTCSLSCDVECVASLHEKEA